ncbi:hypothetical protein [Propionivibrio sp.]|uniref:hypothetical protein n=1 Tax=Propionivibrio sp. TaxID=2212460 RepID=UPI003BF369E5
MTANECAEIARVARAWLLDQDFSPHRRRIAESLYDLASQLTDPNFGCPSEFNAVTVMFQYLQRTIQSLH